MLVPGLPITALAVEALVSGQDRAALSAMPRPSFGAMPSFGQGSLREKARAWQARLLFAACYVFLVGVVAMAG